MNKFVLSFLIFVSSLAFADGEGIQIVFKSPTIKTGEIQYVQFIVDPTVAQNFPLQSLKDQTLEGKIYVRDVSALMKQVGSASYTADAQLIFLKKPETFSMVVTVNQRTVRLWWDYLHVSEIKVPKEYQFLKFSIPEPIRYMIWIALLIVLLFLGLFFWRLWLRYKKKSQMQSNKRAFKGKILTAQNYEQVVELWKTKRDILFEFPELGTAFEKLETVLFKVQFKPQQTAEERELVMKAYKSFVEEGGEVLRGI